MDQVLNYYKYGYRYDNERRGAKFKKDIDAPDWDQIRREVYSEEQVALQEEALKKQFGATAKEGL